MADLAICRYEDGEFYFSYILYTPIVFHGVLVLWNFLKNACKIDADMIHSQWYIFVATITMIVVGSVWSARIDA